MYLMMIWGEGFDVMVFVVREKTDASTVIEHGFMPAFIWLRGGSNGAPPQALADSVLFPSSHLKPAQRHPRFIEQIQPPRISSRLRARASIGRAGLFALHERHAMTTLSAVRNSSRDRLGLLSTCASPESISSSLEPRAPRLQPSLALELRPRILVRLGVVIAHPPLLLPRRTTTSRRVTAPPTPLLSPMILPLPRERSTRRRAVLLTHPDTTCVLVVLEINLVRVAAGGCCARHRSGRQACGRRRQGEGSALA